MVLRVRVEVGFGVEVEVNVVGFRRVRGGGGRVGIVLRRANVHQ